MRTAPVSTSFTRHAVPRTPSARPFAHMRTLPGKPANPGYQKKTAKARAAIAKSNLAGTSRAPGASEGMPRSSPRAISQNPAPRCKYGGATRLEFELGLMQSQMAQKPALRGEVGARALRVRSVLREEATASAGIQSAWVSGCGCEADQGVL